MSIYFQQKQNKMENQITEQQSMDAAVIFGKALNLILKNNEGIVVDVPEHLEMYKIMKKVVIVVSDGTTRVYNCEEDYPEGTPVNVSVVE